MTRLWRTVGYAVGMGYVEAAVVVYLRKLFYPHGFFIAERVGFPFLKFSANVPELNPLDAHTLAVEVGREVATMLMLAMVGWLGGAGRRSRWGHFLVAFAVWDLTYYGWLRLLIGWPESLATTDVLFLIPCPWIAPVWLPMLASCGMIATGVWLVRKRDAA